MIQRRYVRKEQDIPEDWQSHCLVLWEEDDVQYCDKERVAEAFRRIAKAGLVATPLHVIDYQDMVVRFYRGGWVTCVSFDGGWVGVLIGK